MKNLIVALLLLAFLMPSCKKEADIVQENNECFYNPELDSTDIANKLIGNWNWYYSTSGWTAEFSDEENKGLSFEFKPDGTLLVKRKGEETQSVTWSLQPAVNGYYNLSTTPIVIETFGFVLFCKDQLLFNGGAGDGTNNYFKWD